MIGGFDLVRDRMSERPLCKVTGIAVFADPIPKARSETVRSRNAPRRIALYLRATQEGRDGLRRYFASE